ncbi:MAG: glycosyltransferase family 9 protein [Chloroflexota bacterium]
MRGSSLKSIAKAGLWEVAHLVFGAHGLGRQASGRRQTPQLREVRSILAIRLDLMGDLVFTLPALDALREAAPGARISALVLPYTGELLRGHPSVDRVIAVDVNRWRRPGEWAAGGAIRQMVAALREVRREGYDLAVSFYGRVGAAAALLSGADFLVGYREEGYPFTFDLGLEGRRYRESRHESEYCLDLVRTLGAPAGGKLARLSVDPVAARRVEALLHEAGLKPEDSLVALHPGALNMVAKRWLPERWAEVADRLQRETPSRILLVGSAAERPLVEMVRGHMATGAVALGGRTTLPELVALLARCDLFLGCDSGPLHVASALGLPSVSVYGPTDPDITGPLGPRARVLRARADCSPCYDPIKPSDCPRPDPLCMAGVSVDEVWEAVLQVMSDE